MPMVDVKLAVVGIYFGTLGTPTQGASGLKGTKFVDAPSAKIDSKAPVSDLVHKIREEVMKGNVPNCNDFGVETTSIGSIKRIFASYTVGPKMGLNAGLYSVADSTHLGEQIINPKLAWQFYVHDKDFTQVEANGKTRFITEPQLARPFQNGDIVIFRCVLIAKGALDYKPMPDLRSLA
jgi:hypothetical protein